jgi:hypothetical protein
MALGRCEFLDSRLRRYPPTGRRLSKRSGPLQEGGFFVSYEGLREGKSFAKIRFMLAKSAARDDRDTKLQGKARRGRTFRRTESPAVAIGTPYEPTDAVLDQLRTLAPGWDRQALVARYRQWSRGKDAPDNPHGAFLGWVKRFAKNEAQR